MARRLRQTLMDYMVIGISPALIMGMVGSLLFFLLTVFYQGQYEARLHFIFAMFTLAVVLIARISMEEGIEYASMFGIALAIVTALALARFVQIQGALAPYGTLINWGFIAIVWWSAHKLTWDCTFIDDAQDASGEGLLQGMGFDSDTVQRQVAIVQSGGATSTGSSTAAPAAAPDRGKDWYQQLVQRRRRPHTPGVWVMYYALAALPLFAIGQLMIPAADTASRLHAFRLICVYVACALGLLLTTSFLGLRRYLRQRNLAMPADMAGMWLSLGCVMIFGLLLVCALLPRPGASLSISQLPFGIGSRSDLRTNRHALGNDGPERPAEAARTSPNAQQKPAASVPQSGQKPGESPGGTAGKPSVSPPTDPSPSAGDTKPQPSSSAGDAKPGSSTSGGDAKSEPSQRTSDVASQQRSPSREGKSAPQPAQGQPGASGTKNNQPASDSSPNNEQRGPDAKPSQEGKPLSEGQPNGPSQEMQQPPEQSGKQDSAGHNDPARNGKPPDAKPGPNQGASESRQEQLAEQPNASPQPSKSSRPFSSWSPARVLETVAGGLGNLLKLMFFAALVCVAAFFAWKYRGTIGEALAQLWRDIQQLLASLWGGRRQAAAGDEAPTSSQPSGPPLPSFASYTDPFLSGAAERLTTEQLIRYSFEALEAWGREQGVPRDEDQTPLEFAQRIAGRYDDVGAETQMLAELYCRIAYGHERIVPQRRDHLRRLWQQLRAASAASQRSTHMGS